MTDDAIVLSSDDEVVILSDSSDNESEEKKIKPSLWELLREDRKTLIPSSINRVIKPCKLKAPKRQVKTKLIDFIDLTIETDTEETVRENESIEISSTMPSVVLKTPVTLPDQRTKINDSHCKAMAKNIFERIKKSKIIDLCEHTELIIEKNENVPIIVKEENYKNDLVKNSRKPEKRHYTMNVKEEAVVPCKRRNFLDVFINDTFSGDIFKNSFMKPVQLTGPPKSVSSQIPRSIFPSFKFGMCKKLFPKQQFTQTLQNFTSSSCVINELLISQMMPKPIMCHKYLNMLQKSQKVFEFSENFNLTLEAGLEGTEMHLITTINLIRSMTTITCRPSYRFIKEVFDRLASKFTSLNKMKLYYQALHHIHDLHGLPLHLPLWDYIEQIYLIDMITSHSVDLLLKSTFFDLVLHIVDSSILNIKPPNEFAKIRDTVAYRLLSIEKSFGNVKTFFTWLEDTLKLYVQHNNDGKLDTRSCIYNVIVSLQKLIATTIVVSKCPGNNLDRLISEYRIVYNRLDSLEEQKLLLETIHSDKILLHLCECLLERLTQWSDDQNDYDKFSIYKNSPCSIEKIVKYYFQLEIIINTNSWSPNPSNPEPSIDIAKTGIERFLHTVTLLQRAYLNISKLSNAEYHNRSGLSNEDSCVPVLNKHINELEARLDQEYPTVMAFPEIKQLFLILRLNCFSIN